MSRDTTTRERIESLLNDCCVALFMKGYGFQSTGGFSATTHTRLAPLPQARILEDEGYEVLATLPKDTALTFTCQHGISSQGVAERFTAHGFTQMHNVTAGWWRSAIASERQIRLRHS